MHGTSANLTNRWPLTEPPLKHGLFEHSAHSMALAALVKRIVDIVATLNLVGFHTLRAPDATHRAQACIRGMGKDRIARSGRRAALGINSPSPTTVVFELAHLKSWLGSAVVGAPLSMQLTVRHMKH